MPPLESAGDRTLLEHISTHWGMMADPAVFVLRYAPAIRKHLEKILRQQGDAEDVTQDFLIKILHRGFSEDQVTRGRFRDYLRMAIRNTAIDHLRKRRMLELEPSQLDILASPQQEEDWVSDWRSCLLEKAWQRLEKHQHATPGSLAYSILRLATDHPELDSTTLAAQASEKVGRTIRPDAYRQQLHRARERFAQLLVEEVSQTLARFDRDELEIELADLGFLPFVEEFLPKG